jgi:HK97 gp10 family phage protein
MISVTITGVQELQSSLNSYLSSAQNFFSTDMEEVGNQIVSDMQSRAPVLTGYLRDNITVEQANQDMLVIISSAGYSAYVEFGTYKMGAQPFFFDAAYPGLQQIVSDYISKVTF